MTRAGVYKITNKLNHKVYFGQSVDLDKRLKEHRSRLTKFTHHNPYLQKAVNKYNLDNFVFEIIETIEPFDKKTPECILLLDYLESFYIDSYESLASLKGYNIKTGGNNSVGYYHSDTTKYVFFDPNNNKVEIDNLNKFCKENNLHQSAMLRVFKGRCKYHKNWTKYIKTSKSSSNISEVTEYNYTLKSPYGTIYDFNNINLFVLENNLCSKLINNVLKGTRKHHKNWTLPETELVCDDLQFKFCPINKNIKYQWINLKTHEQVYCTVSDLHLKEKIRTYGLYKLTDPNSNYLVFKDWTIVDIENFKTNKKPSYTFIHNEFGIFEGTIKEILTAYTDLSCSKINEIVKKTRKSHKGWSIK